VIKPPDPALCEVLAVQASAGDPLVWKTLVEHLWPWWLSMVRGHPTLGPLRDSDDHVHEVMASLVEKIGADDRRALGLFVVWKRKHPEKTFLDWLRIVTANAVRDHVRQQIGAGLDPVAARDPAVRKLLRDFVTSPEVAERGHRPPMTDEQTARELLHYADEHLPVEQASALRGWMEGATFDELASAGARRPEDAQKLVRAALATLRRRFGGE
jgi:uncharacterized protein (DUF2267 family)